MRQCKDWISEYVNMVTQAAEGTKEYHFWSAATIVASSLKRHVWVDRKTYKLFPNLYVILIGPPGIGKGSALNPAVAFYRLAQTGCFLTGRMTIEYVLEELAKGIGTFVPADAGNGIKVTQENALLLFSPEFAVFASASQFTFKILTDLWDCPTGNWRYGTKTNGKYSIPNPCVTMLAGCTPDALVDLLPNAAVSAGFTRRVNFVFAKENGHLIPWPAAIDMYHEGLISDLRSLSELRGEFTFSPEAKKAFEEYYIGSRTIREFQDEAEASYDTTRWAHATKLAMTLSASRSNDLVISEEDFRTATAKIDECASCLKQVFRGIGDSDFASIIDRVLRYLEFKNTVRPGEYMAPCSATRQQILKDNWRNISAPDLDIALNTLVGMEVIDEIVTGHQLIYRLRERHA